MSEDEEAAISSLQITTEPRGSATVLHVAGELDLSTAGRLGDSVSSVLLANAAGELLVINLTAIDFMASAGITELLAARDEASRRGVNLRVVATNRAVLRPLQITGAAEVLDIHSTVDTATS